MFRSFGKQTNAMFKQRNITDAEDKFYTNENEETF